MTLIFEFCADSRSHIHNVSSPPSSGVVRHYAAFTSYSDFIDQLKGIGHLSLSPLSEPRDNSLRIVVEEAILTKGRVANSTSPALQLLFENDPD
jgi:hypothetical protein